MAKKDAISKTKTKSSKKSAQPKDAKRRPGRPQAVIDWNVVDAYLKAHGTGTEIAAALGIHPETLYDACQRDNNVCFSEYSRQKKECGNILLKTRMMDMAMQGDRATAIFLSKNWLGFRDKPKEEEEGEETPSGPRNVTFTITEELIKDSENESERSIDKAEDTNATEGDGYQLKGRPEEL